MRVKAGDPLGRLVVATTVAGLITLALMAVQWSTSSWHVSLWAVAVTATLAVAGEFVAVPVSIGARRQSLSWGDVSILVGVIFIPIPLLIFIKMGAVLIEQLWTRRGPAPTAFNSFGTAIYAGVTAWTIDGLCHATGAVCGRPASWPLLAIGIFVGNAVNACLVSGAIALSSQTPYTAVLRETAGAQAANVAGNIALTFGVLACWEYSRPTLLALPVIFVALWKLHSSSLHRATESQALSRLATASAAIPATSFDELQSGVRDRASSLFGARGAKLRLLDAERPTASSAVSDSDVTGVSVPLVGRTGALGTLVLDVDQVGALTQRERDVLTTFGNTTAAALETVLAHEAQLHAAQHDTLTGLPNRALLATEAERILGAATANGGRAAVILIDLDGFKNVNDTLGHAAGDRLLLEIGSRLGGSVRPRDCVARLGGDEFVVLLDGLETNVDASRLAATLVERVSVPVTIDGLRIAVEASAGVALFPEDGDNIESLLRCADVAMYDAKRRGAGVQYYDSAQDLASPERLSLLADLQLALDAEDQLHLHFQPQLDMRTGLTGNVEALIRWTHPTRGALSPAEFVPVIEHSALIGPFTLKVLDTAVRACVEWQSDASLHGVGVAVNLSARNLMHRDLPDEVARILARRGLPARKLVLEITETAAMNDTEVCESVLARLRDLGVRLSVDDFGTGYASLTFLRRIDVAEVKLDRAFVADMLEDAAAATIVGATVALAHGLGLTVVAEGVETPEQLAALKLAGCDLAQGFYLSRPVPKELLAERADAVVVKATQAGIVEHFAQVHPPRRPSYRDAGLVIAAAEPDRPL